jgi:hypothetical protein
MTMLDDDLLATLFGRAGDAFDVPAAGPAQILEKAFGVADPPPPPDAPPGGQDDPGGKEPSRLRRAYHSHRVLSVAATVVVVALLAAGVVAAVGTSSPAPRVTAGAPTIGRVPVPTTTVPSQKSALGTAGVAAAPTPGTSAGTNNTFAASGQGATVSGAGSAANGPAVTVPTSPTTSALPPGTVGQSSKIEQTGTLSLGVARGALARTMTQLNALAGAYNGFVATSQSQSGAIAADGVPSGSITLQVPVASFASVLKAAQALGKTDSLTTKATDVTGQYADLQSQITAAEDSRQQYLTIMTKAASVGDVLAVQAQLDTIQTQIQQLEGQLQVLTSETAYSTLSVTVDEAGLPVHHPAPHHRRSGLSQAWHDSVSGFVDGVEGLIKGAGPVLFALLCLAALIVGGRLGWRRYQRHNL